MNPKKNTKTKNKEKNEFLSKKRKTSYDESLISKENKCTKNISKSDEENIIHSKFQSNICSRLPGNIFGYLLQFCNLNTSFNLIKVNKRIKNVILTKSPIFQNFIEVRNFFRNTKKNYLENILDSETTNLIFIKNKLTEKFTPSQVDNFLSEILFTLFDENSHFNNELEIKADSFYLLSLVLISEKCSFRSLNIHKFTQTTETLEILFNIITNNKTLKEIFLGPLQIKNFDYTNVFRSIGKNKFLEYIKFDLFTLKESKNIEGYCTINLMSVFQHIAINKYIKNFHFELFDDFLNNQFLMKSFQKMLEENKSIKHLSLRHHQDVISTDKINFCFLEGNSTIEVLELLGLFSIPNLIKNLTSAKNKSKISKLIIDNSPIEKYVNGIADKDQMIQLNYFSCLSKIIKQVPFIKYITLKNSDIYEDEEFAKAIENANFLKSLSIDCMDTLLNKTFEWLVDILKKNKSLEELSIYTGRSNHKQFQNLVISILIENKNIKSFYFNNENLHRQSLDELRKIIQDRKLNEINKIFNV